MFRRDTSSRANCTLCCCTQPHTPVTSLAHHRAHANRASGTQDRRSSRPLCVVTHMLHTGPTQPAHLQLPISSRHICLSNGNLLSFIGQRANIVKRCENMIIPSDGGNTCAHGWPLSGLGGRRRSCLCGRARACVPNTQQSIRYGELVQIRVFAIAYIRVWMPDFIQHALCVQRQKLEMSR
jgi:hypothetical protein